MMPSARGGQLYFTNISLLSLPPPPSGKPRKPLKNFLRKLPSNVAENLRREKKVEGNTQSAREYQEAESDRV